jgi:hypothetical protein
MKKIVFSTTNSMLTLACCIGWWLSFGARASYGLPGAVEQHNAEISRVLLVTTLSLGLTVATFKHSWQPVAWLNIGVLGLIHVVSAVVFTRFAG